MTQMYGLPNTCARMNDRKAAGDWVSSVTSSVGRRSPAATSVPSTSGRPTDAGVSGRVNSIATATRTAKTAGTMKQSRQEYPTRYPHSTTTAPAPSEWDVFQTDIFVASCRGGNQYV